MNEVSLWYHSILEALGYAILHSLWQSVLLFFPLQVILFFCKQSKLRYRILYSSLSLLFLVFVVTFCVEWNHVVQAQQHSMLLAQFMMDHQIPAGHYKAVTQPPEHWWQQLTGFYNNPRFKQVLPAISSCYVAGVLVLALRMLFALMNISRIRKQVLPASEPLLERFLALVQLISIRRKVTLFFSENINVPLMIGYLKPIVILPVALMNQLDMQQTEAILIHELAHVKRMDYLFNMIQSVIEVFMFFNPMVWWFSSIIRKEREHCCDDIAVQHTAQPVKYAEALLQLELSRNQWQPAMAATGNNKKYSLLNRIKRIIDMKSTSKRTPQSLLAALTLLMFIAASFCYYSAVAQEKSKEAPQKQRPEPAYSDPTTPPDAPKYEDVAKPIPPESPGDDASETSEDIITAIPEAMKAANIAIKEIDWDEVNDAIKQAGAQIEKIDTKEMDQSMKEARKEIKRARKEIANIDWNEISNSVSTATAAVNAVDWDDVSNNITEALRATGVIDKATRDKTMKEVKEALAQAKLECNEAGLDGLNKFDANGVKKLKKLKIIQLQDIDNDRSEALKDAVEARKEALENAREAREEALENARQARQEAIAARQSASDKRSDRTQGLMKKLEQDGLINRNKDFAISYKNNVLKVNGKEVAAESYKAYLPKSKNASLAITGSKHTLAISQKE
jgi:bla regulator protein BlaR1